VQRQELLHDEEPEDDAGPFGDEQVLPEVPQAHAAQGSEVIGDLVICDLVIWSRFAAGSCNHSITQSQNHAMELGA
jgi:hypothetical protein